MEAIGMVRTRGRDFCKQLLLVWGPPAVCAALAIAYKLTCPLAQQNGLRARLVTSAVFVAVSIGLLFYMRYAQLRELRKVRKIADTAQSALLQPPPERSRLTRNAPQQGWRADTTETGGSAYESQLRAAQAEIDHAEICDTVEEVAEFLGALHASYEDAERISSAAVAAEGLTEVFGSLGPPPPGLTEKYGDGGSGSDDGVGAGPRGRNA